MVFFFFFNDTATTEIYTLSLHDALPILVGEGLYGNPNPHDDRKVLPRACGLSFCGCRDGQRNEYQDGGSCGTAQGKSVCPQRVNQVDKKQRSEEHTSELQSRLHLVCRLLL